MSGKTFVIPDSAFLKKETPLIGKQTRQKPVNMALSRQEVSLLSDALQRAQLSVKNTEGFAAMPTARRIMEYEELKKRLGEFSLANYENERWL